MHAAEEGGGHVGGGEGQVRGWERERGLRGEGYRGERCERGRE